MVGGWAAVKEISAALGATLIATTLGNHDVDSRKKHHPNAFHMSRHVARDYPLADDSQRSEFWNDGFTIIDHPAVRIVVINSVAEHHSVAQAERGSVTPELLSNLDRRLRGLPSRQPQVALVHHHPIPHEDSGLGSEDLMVNGSLLLDRLGEHGVRVVVHGHKHHPRLRYYDAAGQQMVIFAAGSFAAISARFFDAGNLFHIVELEAHAALNTTQAGRIKSWAYSHGKGWGPAHPRLHGIPSDTGFGCLLDPSALAADIARLSLAGPTTVLMWADVTQSLPDLSYVTPAHLESVSAELLRVHGIEISVSPETGLPRHVVRS